VGPNMGHHGPNYTQTWIIFRYQMLTQFRRDFWTNVFPIRSSPLEPNGIRGFTFWVGFWSSKGVHNWNKNGSNNTVAEREFFGGGKAQKTEDLVVQGGL
jgi:hypothetical protein